jgi:transposase InsO family protein
MIVGWQVSDTLRAELALDALEMAIWSRGGRIGGRWFTIRTVECSILRSAMLSGSGRSARSGRSAGKVIPMIMRQRNH